MFNGVVQAAEVFAQQATAAGVKVKLNQVNTSVFYGPNYLKWPFAQDFWATREYLPQVAQGSAPAAPFNETHWPPKNAQGARFTKLIAQATAELNAQKHNELLQGGDEDRVRDRRVHHPVLLQPDRRLHGEDGRLRRGGSGFPLGNYWFKNVGYLAS